MKRNLVLDLGPYAGCKPRVEAFLGSVRRAGGSVVEVGPEPADWRVSLERVAAAVTCGMHDREASGRKALRDAGVPVLVLDLGYLKRASKGAHEGYHQLGVNRLGWLPPYECPGDRLKELGVEVLEPKAKPGRRVLVLGQVPWDSQHHMGASQLNAWLRRRVRGVKRLIGERREVVFRPHPEGGNPEQWNREWVGIEGPEEVTLAEAIGKSAVVVTYNSTAAVEAIRQGVPVICHPDAHYAEAAWCATKTHREGYFRRLAYGQWSLDELRDGSALKFAGQWMRR